MTRPKAALREVSSALGVVTEGLNVLMRYGVTRNDWSRLLADPEFAASVAATMHDGTLPQLPTIDQLVAEARGAGKLERVSQYITTANFPEAQVRGKLVVVGFHLDTHLSSAQMLERLAGLGYSPATMYELVYFATSQWDGRTSVAALGTMWDYGDQVCVGQLSKVHVPSLDLRADSALHRYGWSILDRFLVVRNHSILDLTNS